MMRSAFAAVETSEKIAMSVLAPRDMAPLIFQAMHRTRSIYFAAPVLADRTRQLTSNRSGAQIRARCPAQSAVITMRRRRTDQTLLRRQSNGARF